MVEKVGTVRTEPTRLAEPVAYTAVAVETATVIQKLQREVWGMGVAVDYRTRQAVQEHHFMVCR